MVIQSAYFAHFFQYLSIIPENRVRIYDLTPSAESTLSPVSEQIHQRLLVMLDSTTKAFLTLFVITHTTAAATNTRGTHTHPSNPAGTRPAWRQCVTAAKVSRFFVCFLYIANRACPIWAPAGGTSGVGEASPFTHAEFFSYFQKQSVTLAREFATASHANGLALQVKLLANYLSELAMVLLALTSREMDGKCALETVQD